jgi:ribosomal protein S18 acetylase RimI-like enzyme
VKACEAYLRHAGAEAIFAGPHRPLDPFYLGLYGGSEAGGFLGSDPAAEAFFRRLGYDVSQTTLVFQRSLKLPLKVVDTRFVGHRQHFDVRVAPPRSGGQWWQECVFNVVEPLEFYLEEKTSGTVAARTLAWEMEGFAQRWSQPAVGLVDVHVEAPWRGRGLGKYLLTLLLRHIQEQFFEIAELHVAEENEIGIALSQSLGFQQVDTGRVFKKVGP